MELAPAAERFILHWGEMGSRWGVNRTIAQIHALLYLADEPLPADEIANLLAVARSNVSMSLRELQGYGLIRTEHVLGDRRDHFKATDDMWSLFLTILDERKKREIDPTVRTLHEIADLAESDKRISEPMRTKIQDMRGFLDDMNRWYKEIRTVPENQLVKLFKLGKRVTRVLSR